LKDRWSRHKSQGNNTCSKQLMGFDDVRMELMEEFVCDSRATLRQREQWWIDNHPCCNQQNAFGYDKENSKERDKAYREAHKENTKEYNKAYREANKENFKEYHKAYFKANYQANRERKNELQRIRRAKLK